MSFWLMKRAGSEVYPDPAVRVSWLDALKVVAAFAVVVTHIASIGWQVIRPATDEWFITSVFEIATRFAVPSFFMVSGALLLNPRRNVSTRVVLLRYVPRAAILALLISFLYCALEHMLGEWTGWRAVVVATLDGPYFIWYLWALVGLYVLTPLLRMVCMRAAALRYSLVVFGIFVMLKGTVEVMLPGSVISAWLGNFSLFSSDMGPIFYYLLGAWLISHEPNGKCSYIMICMGVAALLVAIGVNHANALYVGADLDFVGRNNLLIAVYSMGVFELFRRASKWCERHEYMLGKIVSLGMGVYLIHPFFRLTMERLSLFEPVVGWLLLNPIVSIPVVSVVIWGMSVAASLMCSFVMRVCRSAA